MDLDQQEPLSLAFSPNGEWLAVGGQRPAQLRPRNGREPFAFAAIRAGWTVSVGFGRGGDILVATGPAISASGRSPRVANSAMRFEEGQDYKVALHERRRFLHLDHGGTAEVIR